MRASRRVDTPRRALFIDRAIVEAVGARIFVLRSGGGMRGDEMVEVLGSALEAMHRLAAKYDAPFIAHVSAEGNVSMPLRYEARRRNPRPGRGR